MCGLAISAYRATSVHQEILCPVQVFLEVHHLRHELLPITSYNFRLHLYDFRLHLYDFCLYLNLTIERK